MATYAINTVTRGVSEYSGVPLIGVVEREGSSFGITTTQLYEMAGSDDDGTPINTYITTGNLSVAGLQAFNCPKSTLVVEGTEFTLERFTQEQGATKTLDSITQTVESVLDEYEVLLETRQHARSYQFKLTLDGYLDYWSVYVNPVRHRRG